MTATHTLMIKILRQLIWVFLIFFFHNTTCAQIQVHVDATLNGNGILFPVSGSENAIVFPRHLLEADFFDNDRIKVTIDEGISFFASNRLVAEDLDIAIFVSNLPANNNLSQYQYDEANYLKAINSNKTGCYLSKRLSSGAIDDKPVFLSGELNGLLVIRGNGQGVGFSKTDSGSGLYSEVDGEVVFLGYLIKVGTLGEEEIAYVFPADRIDELYGKELRYKKYSLNLNPIRNPLVKTNKQFLLPALEITTGLSIIAIGHNVFYRRGEDIFSDYSNYRSEAEFLIQNTNYSSREAAYIEAEKNRRKARNFILVGGIFVIVGVFDLTLPLFDGHTLFRAGAVENGLGVQLKF